MRIIFYFIIILLKNGHNLKLYLSSIYKNKFTFIFVQPLKKIKRWK
jgi:hypothetical protein